MSLYVQLCARVLSCFSRVRLSAAPGTAALQAPLSPGFSRQDTGGGCHALLQGVFPTLRSPAWAGGFCATSGT